MVGCSENPWHLWGKLSQVITILDPLSQVTVFCAIIEGHLYFE